MATAAGAGGGALFVPLFSAFLQFSELFTSHVFATLSVHNVVAYGHQAQLHAGLCCCNVVSQGQQQLVTPKDISGGLCNMLLTSGVIKPIACSGVKDSTALSQAVITGGAVAGTSFALFQKHPAMPTCPLIQFDLALVLIPSLLLGTSIGKLTHPCTLYFARCLLVQEHQHGGTPGLWLTCISLYSC